MNDWVCLYYTALRPSWEVLLHIKVLNFCNNLPQTGLPLNQAGHLVGSSLLAVLVEEGGDDEGGAADLPLGDGGGLFLVQRLALLSRPKGTAPDAPIRRGAWRTGVPYSPGGGAARTAHPRYREYPSHTCGWDPLQGQQVCRDAAGRLFAILAASPLPGATQRRFLRRMSRQFRPPPRGRSFSRKLPLGSFDAIVLTGPTGGPQEVMALALASLVQLWNTRILIMSGEAPLFVKVRRGGSEKPLYYIGVNSVKSVGVFQKKF